MSSADETDIAVLKNLLEGDTYDTVSEKHFLSPNTVEYRVKPICSRRRLPGENELLDTLRRYRILQ